MEARVTRDLMAQIRPGLTLDLHEHGGDGFWFSARHQGNDDDEAWEQRMAQAMIAAVADSGAALMDDDYLPGSFFTKSRNSVYWLDPRQRGEGFNLADFGALRYGPAFTIETGMTTGFDNRVRAAMLAAQTAIRVFKLLATVAMRLLLRRAPGFGRARREWTYPELLLAPAEGPAP